MLAKATILLLGVTAAGINAAFIVDSSPHDLNARTANAAGGWALSQTTSFSCPAGNPACGSFWCCPSSLACVTLGSEDIADVCCPTDADCSPSFTTSPICADSSWALWNATFVTAERHAYFCCLQGQIGLQSGFCADNDSVAATGQPQAILIGATSSTVQSKTSVSSAAPSSTDIALTTSTTATSTPSVTAASTGTGTSASTSISTSISTSTASAMSKATTSAPKTSVAAASMSSSASVATSAAVVTGKSEAVSFNRLGGMSLRGVMAAVFALVLL